eukprot:7756664-Pyramimonas_sp.AAC.1
MAESEVDEDGFGGIDALVAEERAARSRPTRCMRRLRSRRSWRSRGRSGAETSPEQSSEAGSALRPG